MGRFWVPNEAEVGFLATIFQGSFELTFHLFKNAIVVEDDTTLADFTEADYSGYAAQSAAAITPISSNGFAGLDNLKGFTGSYSAIFPGNSGSAQTVYGVYVTYLDPMATLVLLGAANVFDTNPTLSLAGKTISSPDDITPVVFNLRLWDFFTGRPAIPVGEHWGLWPDTYEPTPGTGFNLGVVDLLSDSMINLASTRTATFTSTDPSAVLPADLDFTGITTAQTVAVTLVTPGSQSVTATDTVDGTILGKVSFLNTF